MKSNRKGVGIDYNIDKGNTQRQVLSKKLETTLYDQKIELATDGLEPHYLDHLRTRISKKTPLLLHVT